MVRIRTIRAVFSFLRNQARNKNVAMRISFRNEILTYVKSLRTRKAQEVYPKFREIREPYERLIMSVIGYNAIVLADELDKPVDGNIVKMAIDKLKAPERHEPDDPDDTCRKTAALLIMEKKEEFIDSLPLHPDFVWYS